ncbi:MAG: trypsin-like peptidase domain-containing protein [Actinobacteria bacterium]|nr:trypsin-like peptidase domain-containing protein [Actinomycetota bacterium]
MAFRYTSLVLISLALTGITTGSAVAELSESDLAGAVTIITEDAQGSGFYISKSELMTAAHVIGNAREVRINSRDGQTQEPGEVAVVNQECDVAIVNVKETEREIFILSDEAAFIGDSVFAIGSPIGRPVLSVGKITSANEFSISTSVPVDSGSSGGPLITSEREVVGVVVQKNQIGDAIAVPIEKAKECLEEARNAKVLSPTQHIQSQGVLAISILAITISMIAIFLSLLTLLRLREKRKPIVITLPPEQPIER